MKKPFQIIAIDRTGRRWVIGSFSKKENAERRLELERRWNEKSFISSCTYELIDRSSQETP